MSSRRRRRGNSSVGGGGGGPVIVIDDQFNRVTSGNPGASTDGGAWSDFTTYFECDGTKLINNQASAFYYISRNAGSPNFTLEFKVALAALALTGFRWRAAADNSSYLAFAKNDDTHWYIFKSVSGVDTADFAKLCPIADGDIIKIVCSGNDSAVYHNTVLQYTYTDTDTAGNSNLGPSVRSSSLAPGSHAWDYVHVTVP